MILWLCWHVFLYSINYFNNLSGGGFVICVGSNVDGLSKIWQTYWNYIRFFM